MQTLENTTNGNGLIDLGGSDESVNRLTDVPAVLTPAKPLKATRTVINCKVAIDCNIPLPEGSTSKFRQYPIAELQVGESFVFLGASRSRASSFCSYWGRKLKRTFVFAIGSGSAAALSTSSTQAYRIWRTK